jgi:hypothetical protein
VRDPKDYLPYTNMGFISSNLGTWEKVLEENHEALRLEPNDTKQDTRHMKLSDVVEESAKVNRL